VERQRIDLGEVVRRTSDDHRALFAQHHLALEVVLPEPPVWVDGDATRLAQVLGNLLQNAAKFTPSEGSIRVSLEVVHRSAELRVRDTGVGLDPALLSRLFQPFAQGESTLERTQGGLGLGLALVKGLVELHGGTVEAHSAGKGAGTELVVRLPLSAPPEAIAEVPRAPAGPRRILVIEDNPDAAFAARRAERGSRVTPGRRTAPASSRRRTRRRASSNPPRPQGREPRASAGSEDGSRRRP
jgi:two-component system, chemotaxis family, CheB/CheR fusion protein